MEETIDRVTIQGKTYIVDIKSSPIIGEGKPFVFEDLREERQVVKHDDLFLISNRNGDIPANNTGGLGLYSQDVRYLSCLELRVNGHIPTLLSSTTESGFTASILSCNGQFDGIPQQTVRIQRESVIFGALHERVSITNYNSFPIKLTLAVSFDSDFADMFEVRGMRRERRGRYLEPVIDEKTATFTLAYLGVTGELLETRIHFSENLPAHIEDRTAIYQFHLDPHSTQRFSYSISTLRAEKPTVAISPVYYEHAVASANASFSDYLERCARVETDNRLFNRTLDRSLRDLFILRNSFDGENYVAAGVPWFASLFGRDSLISSMQTMMLNSKLMRDTLVLLARYQGQRVDPWRDEEPGKILHELRLGEMARSGEIPHTPYYGSVDSTPLWLMGLARYYSWTADLEFVQKMWPAALSAIEWMDRYGFQDGYLVYHRSSDKGLLNQGWKDSGDSVIHRDGTLADSPIALCEAQGYAYAAKLRCGELARALGDERLARKLQQEADDLKERFNRDFWLDDIDYCAMALDANKRAIASVTSNPGHCLWTGIFTPEHTRSVAERLFAPDMYSGWGLRTLSQQSIAFNPMSYHNGSIWPHDNGIIARGLRLYGFITESLRIVSSLFEVAITQPYFRLPELFCGFARDVQEVPVQYPVACSPQAWAAGSIYHLLMCMLNLVPDTPQNRLHIIDPQLPDWLNSVTIQNLHVGSSVLNLKFFRSGVRTICEVMEKRGNIRVMIES